MEPAGSGGGGALERKRHVSAWRRVHNGLMYAPVVGDASHPPAFSLAGQPPVGFIPISDAGRSLAFYRDRLGLRLVAEQLPFAVVLEAGGVMLRLTLVGEVKAQPFTIFGWRVTDAELAVATLTAAGVEFARFPGMPQDELGIWDAPGGARVAWFRDPDGNVLSVSENPEWPK